MQISVIKQNLINAKNNLDRELARFKAIDSFFQKAVHAADSHDFAVITVESVIEVFEVECAALFAYDKGRNSLKVVTALGIGRLEAEYPLVMDWMVMKETLEKQPRVFIEQSRPDVHWWPAGLCQVIYSPFYNSGDLRGVLLGGRSAEKQVYYDEIKEELIPSFTVFTQQMSTLLYKLESHQYLENMVREQTEELVKANAKLTRANECLQLEIVERKRAEELSRESARKLRTIGDAAMDAIVMIDKESKISYWNCAAEKIFGYSSEEVLGKYLPSILAPQELYDIFKKEFGKFMQTGEGHVEGKSFEFTAVKKNGTTFPVEISVSSMYIVGQWQAAGIIRDITRRKKMEEELLRAQKLESIGVLAGGIAHDFNNILMGIDGYAFLMLKDIHPSHPHYAKLQSIKEQVQSGAKLISQLLGYARKGKYEVKPLNIGQLIEESSEAFGRTRKEITISRFLCRDLFTIKADRGQMEQILLNLYINAADAMPDGGSLILKTMNRTYEEMSHKIYEPRPGRYVELVVTDTGEGIDKDDMKRIFDPFFTTKEMGRGTGLGLASVYGIIKANNGYIDVESEKGEGTTFKIYLPSSEEKVLKIERFAEEVIKGNKTILFIDDEEIVRDACKHMLEAIGYRVLTAGNGKEALEIYREYSLRIDIILLDMIMPGMNGSEVYDRITGINPYAKIILATGYSIDGQATEILERGCDGFIQKPFRLKDLHKKIIKVLKK